jgi:prepilin-type N-terminal cleavage/methylation domain-containing protein
MISNKNLTSGYRKKILYNAFSLIELSIVVLIIGVLIAGVTQGSRLVRQSRQKTAQNLTSGSPISSIPDLALWLEPTLNGSITSASNGSDVEDLDLVSSWNDINPQSTAKINLTQATQANQPTYIVNGINGIPSLKFNNSFLYSLTAPIIAGNNSYTMVAVWKMVSVADGILMEQRPTTFAAANFYASFWFNSSNFRFSGMANDTGTLANMSVGMNIIDIMVVNNSISPNINNYFNSNTVVSGTTGAPSSLAIGNYAFSVGARTGSPVTAINSPPNVLMSEVMVFNRALKKSEVININNYLSKKYGIALQ